MYKGAKPDIITVDKGVKTMEVLIRKFDKKDIRDAILIWNQVVEDGVAFPQTELLDESSGMRLFEE